MTEGGGEGDRDERRVTKRMHSRILSRHSRESGNPESSSAEDLKNGSPLVGGDDRGGRHSRGSGNPGFLPEALKT